MATFDVESQEGAPFKVRVGGLGDQQLRSLREFFKQDGIELIVVATHTGADLARVNRAARGLGEWDDSPVHDDADVV